MVINIYFVVGGGNENKFMKNVSFNMDQDMEEDNGFLVKIVETYLKLLVTMELPEKDRPFCSIEQKCVLFILLCCYMH